MELAEDGLRVHTVAPETPDDKVSVGEVRTATCGVTWTTSVVDPEELSKLPACYNCVEALAIKAFSDFNMLTEALNTYDQSR